MVSLHTDYFTTNDYNPKNVCNNRWTKVRWAKVRWSNVRLAKFRAPPNMAMFSMLDQVCDIALKSKPIFPGFIFCAPTYRHVVGAADT